MDNKMLISKLREISRSKSTSTFKRMLFKMAAQRIEKLETLSARLVADLKEVDTDCRKCLHNKTPAPCVDSDEEVFCNDCPYGCECKDCYDNSKYEYDTGLELQKVHQGGMCEK